MNPNHHRWRAFRKGFAMHVVLKSNVQVFYGNRSKITIDWILSHFGKHFEVKIYHRALVGNHLHLILLPKDNAKLSGFLRVVAGQISAKLWKNNSPFWKSRPWSRIVHWGKHYSTAIKYVALNYLEGTKQIIRSKNARSELHRYARAIQEVLEDGLTQPPPS